MKRITSLLLLLFCFTLTMNAQSPQSTTSIEDLLERLEQYGNSPVYEQANLFTAQERLLLKNHFASQYGNNRSSMVVDYTLDQTGTFAPIDISVSGIEVALSDDDGTGPIPMGFTFNFIGTDYTDIYISSNGYLTFDPADVTDLSDDAIPDPNLPNNIIAVAWDDLDPGNGGQPAMNVVRYSTEGVAPNRVFVVEYFNVDQFPTGNNVTTQAELYEGTNVIEIHTTAKPSDGGPSTQGIENFDGSDGLAVPGRNNEIWDIVNDFVSFTPNSGGGPMDGVYAYDAGFCSDDFGTFPVAGPYTINVINSFAVSIFSGDFDNTGTLYAMDNTTLELITVDTTLGTTAVVGPLTNIVAGHNTRGLAWDESTGTMYLLSGAGDDVTLYTVDLLSGTLTVVGTTTIAGLIGIWLAIDNNGNAYMADIGLDNLYSMDLGTGTATTIGPLGINISFAQDADFDPATNTLYMGAYTGGGTNQWASVNLATGAATPLGTVNADCAELGIVAIAGTIALGNDTCATATPIACGETLSGDTSDGNTDTNGAQDPNLLSPDEWFVFTSTTPGEIVTVSTCNQAGYDTRLSVWEDCTLANQIAQNDDGPGCSGFTSLLQFQADGSSTYYIAVDGFNGASGAFDLTITCELPPANDDCTNAIAIACDSQTLGTTINSTDDSAVAPDCTGPGTTSGVWYVYTDTTGLVTDINLNTCGPNTDYDTQISVYTGDCGTLTCLTGNDDSPNCTNFQSEVDFQSDGSSTYYILVHGFGTATGNFELNMTCTPVPPPNDMIVNSIDVDEIGFPYTDPAVAMPAATTENGNPSGCNIDGGKGVWYNFLSLGNGTATATITSPAGASFVTFFKAPNETAVETDLEYFFQIGNQCAPATTANITTEAGQVYYVYVVNDGGITDIVIDGTLLGVDENAIQGFTYYPNPADDILNLNALDIIENVAIYNLLGQQVLGQDVNAASSQLNISALATGAYMMKVSVNGQIGTYKIIKK